MNKILQRIAEKYNVLNRNLEKINLLNEFIKGKKLTEKGNLLKNSLLPILIERAKIIADNLKQNNKKVSPIILKNRLNLLYLTYMTDDKILDKNMDEYDSPEILNIDKQHIFDIICSQICKEHINEIISESPSIPDTKETSKKVLSETRIKFELKPIRFPKHYPKCLDYKNLTDYFINYFNSNDEKIKNIMEDEGNKTVFKYLANDIYDIIKTNLNNILPLIHFPKTKEAGGRLYRHTWQGFDDFQRDDAKAIFTEFGLNTNLANKFLETKNLSAEKIINFLSINSWSTFMDNVYISKHDENLEWTVREYLRNLNEEIHQQHSDDILNQNIDVEKTTTIDYNPRYDNYRSGPIVVIRQFNNKGDYVKDEAHEGIPGSNHLSVFKSLGFNNGIIAPNSIYDHCFAKEDKDKTNPIFAEAYRVGDVGFIYENNPNYQGLLTPKEIAQIIKKDCGLEQIFILPPRPQGGIITRLAKKVK